MITIEPHSPAHAPPRCKPSLVGAIWLSIAAAWQGLMRHRAQALRNRRDLEALSNLDDHQLKDIGLVRGQINSLMADRDRSSFR